MAPQASRLTAVHVPAIDAPVTHGKSTAIARVK